MTGTPVIAYRDRVKALLAYTLEHRLAALPACAAPGPAWVVESPWDIWWLCCRAGASSTELGLNLLAPQAECARCRADALMLVTFSPPRHPGELGPRDCGCLSAWAVRMREPAPPIGWPPLRVWAAMVKPGADQVAVRRMLTARYTLIDTQDRRLSTGDVRRLYPDAYGAAYLARQDAYLTGSPVRCYLLLSDPPASTTGADLAGAVKAEIRHSLGDGDVLRNHVHMPDNPGDALCDIEHLFDQRRLLQLYGRYDRDTAPARIAGYRAVLERG